MTAGACNLQRISRMLRNDLYVDHLNIPSRQLHVQS